MISSIRDIILIFFLSIYVYVYWTNKVQLFLKKILNPEWSHFYEEHINS